MHHRFLFVLLACAFLAANFGRAQGNPPAQTKFPSRGEVWVAKYENSVTIVEKSGVRTRLQGRTTTPIPLSARIITASDASAVLVFSNKAMAQIGPGSEVELQKFLDDDTALPDQGGDPEIEEGKSETRLYLHRGEITGKVKLRKDRSSSFEVHTPAGVAGIRGTVFRIIYMPPAAGQTVGTFRLVNTDGGVIYSSPGSSGGGGGGGPPTGQGNPDPNGGGGNPNAPGGGGSQPAGPSISAFGTTQGLDIPAGQQIEITLVSNNGQIAPQTPISTSQTGAPVPAPIPPALAQQIKELSVAIVLAVQQANFTPVPSPSGGATPPNPGTGETGGPGGAGGTGNTSGPGGNSGGGQSGTSTATIDANAGGASATGTVVKVTPPPPTPAPPRSTGP